MGGRGAPTDVSGELGCRNLAIVDPPPIISVSKLPKNAEWADLMIGQDEGYSGKS